MAAMTRGPLPSSVYWRRRLVVLTVAIVLIWGIAHLLGGGGDPKPKAVADLSGAVTNPTPSVTPSPSLTPTPTPTPTPSPTPEPLPTPTGPCAPSDVSVTPSVTNAVAGSDVAVLLTLQTYNTPACTWQVSRRTMQVKITTAGGAEVWSTIQCKSALPSSTVTLYQEQPTPVTATWSSRLADATCSAHTDWAKPGTYKVTGVALGGEPTDASFELSLPAPPPKPTPTPTPTAKPTTKPTTKAAPKPTATPTAKATAKKKPVIAD